MSCSRKVERTLIAFALAPLFLLGALPVAGAALIAAAPETTAAPAPVEAPEAPEAPEPPEGGDDTSLIRIEMEGIEDGDMVRVGQSLTIEKDLAVGGDAVVIGGNLDILGSVAGDAVVVGGTLHIFPGASVAGDAVAVGGTVIRDAGSAVGGQHVTIGGGVDKLLPWGWHRREASVSKGILHVLLDTLGRMVAGFLAILIFVDLFGKRTARIAKRVDEDTFRSGLVGLVAMILIPVSILVLVISCLGILLLPVLGVLLGVAFIWGIVVAALLVGRTLGRRFFPAARADRWEALIGLALLCATNFAGLLLLTFGGPVRFLGWTLLIAGKVILVLAFLVGFGGVVWTRFGRKKPGEDVVEEGTVPPPAPAAGL